MHANSAASSSYSLADPNVRLRRRAHLRRDPPVASPQPDDGVERKSLLEGGVLRGFARPFERLQLQEPLSLFARLIVHVLVLKALLDKEVPYLAGRRGAGLFSDLNTARRQVGLAFYQSAATKWKSQSKRHYRSDATFVVTCSHTAFLEKRKSCRRKGREHRAPLITTEPKLSPLFSLERTAREQDENADLLLLDLSSILLSC